MFINLIDHDVSFIIPKKSGNKVIYSTLMHLFKIYNIDYTISDETERYKNNCYLFVRNPVDRFFSSYDWYLRLLNSDSGFSESDRKVQVDTIQLFNDFEINSLSDYIENYIKFINVCQDFHYLPQSSYFIKKTQDNGVRANLNLNFRKSYDSLFPDNYKIFRIEEIDEIIEKNMINLKLSKYGDKLETNKTISNYGTIKFPFLNFLPENISAKFMMFYTFFQSYYAINHHSKNKNYYYNEITLEKYISVYNMFKKELIFFGYDDEVNTEKNFFKKTVI